MPKLDSGSRSLEIVIFVTIVALFIFVGDKAGMRAVGCAMIFSAARHQLNGRIPFGWEGRKPSGFLTSHIATVLNFIAAVLGVAAIAWPEIAIKLLGWDGP